MNSRRHRLSLPMRFVVVIFTFSALVVGLILKLEALMAPPFDDLSFDRTAWQSVRTDDEKERRSKMSGDLTRHFLKVGMTAKEVTALLGPPEKQTDDPYHWTRIPAVPGVHELFQYRMGHPWRNISGDSYLLQVYFDKKSRYIASFVEVD